ncbi:MAG: tRNA (adenosine(37)-N6)-threonylcarbamoyltransferase complex dimerization subunit type 1 TsaB [Hyphomicrobium sp.]|nr:tRNA (adenosine(37)-N6)-threonylcarbamoyltransferase complex dimerization subunit type 1 TsaB [Hyphomicrobium sp.]
MVIVGFDTCLGACSVALGDGLGSASPRRASRFEVMAAGHAERLMPMLDEVLSELGLELRSVSRILATVGPGTFTGTRISVATARALHLALRVPVVTMTSLEVMALSPALTGIESGRDLLIASDAHRGEAYVQLFDGATRAALGAPRVVSVTDVSWLPQDRALVIAGSASAAIRAASKDRDLVAGPIGLLPRIADALENAVAQPLSVGAPTPLYLRPPDAKPQDGKSLARAAL